MLHSNTVGLLLSNVEEREVVRRAALQSGLRPVDLSNQPEDADLISETDISEIEPSDYDAGAEPSAGMRGLALVVTDVPWDPARKEQPAKALSGNAGFFGDAVPLVILVRTQAQLLDAPTQDEYAWVLRRPLRVETARALLAQASHVNQLFANRHHAVLEELHRSRRIFDSVCNGVTISDATAPDLPLVYVNSAFERMTGYTAHEVCGRNCRFLQGNDNDQPGLTEIRKAIREPCESRVLLKNYRKDGTLFWNELSLSPILDLEGRLTHFVGIQNDVTVQVESTQRLDHLASHDYLTGLANRALLMEQLKQSLMRARRNSENVALLFFDLDNFKLVNDVLGHDAGDQLLQLVAGRLRGETRGGEVVARLGGDEFVVVLEGFSDERRPLGVMRRLTSKVSEPVLLLEQTFRPATSAGMALFPRDADTAEDLLKTADLNMYAAKHNARARAQASKQLWPPG